MSCGGYCGRRVTQRHKIASLKQFSKYSQLPQRGLGMLDVQMSITEEYNMNGHDRRMKREKAMASVQINAQSLIQHRVGNG